MFRYQNVRESVFSQNLLYAILSPLSILKNPSCRPRWPPYISSTIIHIVNKITGINYLINFNLSASSFSTTIYKIYIFSIKRLNGTTIDGILIILRTFDVKKAVLPGKSPLYERLVIHNFYQFVCTRLYGKTNVFCVFR